MKRSIFTFSLIVAISFLTPPDNAVAITSCKNHKFVNIIALDGGHHAAVCKASQKAIDLLACYGLYLKRPVPIQLIETSINNRVYLAFGSYDRSQGIIPLMSYEAIMEGTAPQMCDQPVDMEHYHGAIAYEIAHAVFQHNTSGIEDQLTNATQEYLAHATQLGVLSPQRRQQIIEASEVGAWGSGDSISEIYMWPNPTECALTSYLYLSKLDDRQPFIGTLLNNNWFNLSVS